MDLENKLKEFESEILSLKTAQPLPAYLTTFTRDGLYPAGTYNEGQTYTWTIYYKDTGDRSTPLTQAVYISSRCSLLLYNPTTNSQIFELVGGGGTLYVDSIVRFRSSRPIDRVMPNF